MPAKSETFLLKYSYTSTDSETGITSTVNEEGVGISYPVTTTGFDEVLTANSDPVRGDGYYGRADGFHTVQYNLAGLIGTVKIQATLAVEPTESDWFTVYENAYNLQSTPGIEEEANSLTNFIGNYVHVRAVIDNWTGGSVNSIYLNH